MALHVPEIEWDSKFILNYFLSCLIVDKGVPRFMTKIFGVELPDNSAILVCRDLDDEDILSSFLVKDIPQPIYNIILEKHHRDLAEWKKVMSALIQPEFIDKLSTVYGISRYFRPLDKERMKVYSMYFEQKGVKPISLEDSLKILNKILESKQNVEKIR